jgi:outer membrane protein assembly factor BamE (lipoprotein component of BamABCDE complex)
MASFRILLSSCVMLVLAACTPHIDYRGKTPEPADVKKIRIGTDYKEDVLRHIGSPTFETIYGDSTWYYVYRKTETTSFFTPEIIEKNILKVSFDPSGRVATIEDIDPEGVDIDPITHKTKTVGSDPSLMRQVFGNFGRLARKDKKQAGQ